MHGQMLYKVLRPSNFLHFVLALFLHQLQAKKPSTLKYLSIIKTASGFQYYPARQSLREEHSFRCQHFQLLDRRKPAMCLQVRFHLPIQKMNQPGGYFYLYTHLRNRQPAVLILPKIHPGSPMYYLLTASRW